MKKYIELKQENDPQRAYTYIYLMMHSALYTKPVAMNHIDQTDILLTVEPTGRAPLHFNQVFNKYICQSLENFKKSIYMH